MYARYFYHNIVNITTDNSSYHVSKAVTYSLPTISRANPSCKYVYVIETKKKTGNNTNWSLLAQKAGGNIECFRIILRVVGASFLCIADSVGLQEFKVKMWKVAIIGRYSCWSTALFNRHKLLTLLNTSLQCTV